MLLVFFGLLYGLLDVDVFVEQIPVKLLQDERQGAVFLVSKGAIGQRIRPPGPSL